MSLSIPLWRKILSQNFTRWETLAPYLGLSESVGIRPKNFPLNLPQRLAAKIEKGNIHDPLFLQFVPQPKELIAIPGFQKDPVDDEEFRRTPKLLKKYNNRALLLASGVCAMHCRYCFRQNFDYARHHTPFEKELAYLRSDPSIQEVILSGGDPLSLTDEALKALIEAIAAIPHVKKLRFHSRFPMGIPERITPEFTSLLRQSRLQTYFVLHCNHPREFDEEVLEALRAIRLTGAILLSQSVLLRGINDNLPTLLALCNLLVDNGILPYYLHQFDQVQGGAHFEVSEEIGIALVTELARHLPGYAVPKYVREIAGEQSKTPCGSNTLSMSYKPL